MTADYGFSRVFKKFEDDEDVIEVSPQEVFDNTGGFVAKPLDPNEVRTTLLASKCCREVYRDNDGANKEHWFVCTKCDVKCEIMELHCGNTEGK